MDAESYRILVTELEHGSTTYDELVAELDDDGYQVVETRLDGLDALDTPVTDWYDGLVVSMDDARSVEYHGDRLDDTHVVLEGVTPLYQPDHIDASYNTADRVERVVRSIRQDEWQRQDGVGEELAAVLDNERPGEMDDDTIEELLEDEYSSAGPMLAARIENG